MTYGRWTPQVRVHRDREETRRDADVIVRLHPVIRKALRLVVDRVT